MGRINTAAAAAASAAAFCKTALSGSLSAAKLLVMLPTLFPTNNTYDDNGLLKGFVS